MTKRDLAQATFNNLVEDLPAGVGSVLQDCLAVLSEGNGDQGDFGGNDPDDDQEFVGFAPADAPAPYAPRQGLQADTILNVRADDLWALVNQSRRMVRLAREGKVPNQEQRGPLNRAIKAIKGKHGLSKRKPAGYVDRD